jgi:YidC/Oxa1 family membrane protein insertase
VTRTKDLLVRLAPLLFIVGVALVVAACAGSPAGSSGSASPTPTQAPLRPAEFSPNPADLLAWLFNPVFQTFFIALVLLHQLTGSMIVSILLLTLIIKVLMTPITRRQLVSSRQTQMLAPEVRELQRKYKGDRAKQQAAVQEFYKQRGINPAGGCLPSLLQLGLLIPMYSVFNQGLTNYNINAALNVFGIQLFTLPCDAAPISNAAGHVTNACLKPVELGINWGLAEPVATGLYIAGFGISILAILSSVAQLVASRQMIPPTDPKAPEDPNVKVQKQMAYFLPLISIFYGGFLPAGLFLYWIASTVIQVFQQYLIIGWGGIFPLFGWHPEFARNHTPRFPIPVPAPKPPAPGQSTSAAERARAVDRGIAAQSTIRPNRSRTTGRRGRRR